MQRRVLQTIYKKYKTPATSYARDDQLSTKPSYLFATTIAELLLDMNKLKPFQGPTRYMQDGECKRGGERKISAHTWGIRVLANPYEGAQRNVQGCLASVARGALSVIKIVHASLTIFLWLRHANSIMMDTFVHHDRNSTMATSYYFLRRKCGCDD